jgi:hypothetical protein
LFLKEKAIPTAALIRKNAIRSFESGSIGFLELSQFLKRSLTTEEQYILNRNQLKISELYLNYITSEL